MNPQASWPEHAYDCSGWQGEMAGRIAAFEWGRTAMGPIDSWSNSLQSAVRFVLASPLPLVMLWGIPGTMIYNDAYAVFAGGRHPFLLGKPVEDGWPEVAAFNRNVVDSCLTGQVLSYKDKQLTLHRSGKPEEVWMDLHYSPVTEDDGRPAGVISIVFETTEKVLAERERQIAEDKLHRLTQTLEERVAVAVTARVEAEERFRQVQKLEAIGNLTGGVAHDFNNVLQIISSNAQLLELLARDTPRLKERLDIISSAVSRGSKLASQMLAFARRQPLNPKVVRPLTLLNSVSDLMAHALPEHIALSSVVAEDVGNLLVDRNQLENALLNLIINSRDAIRERGDIHVDVRNDAGNRTLSSGLALPEGGYVRFSVTDTGVGMSEHVKSRMFEPFFSTKPEGHGTGLGLSMVFGFVSQSAGYVEVDSEVNQGTTITLYFPMCSEPECASEGTLPVNPRSVTGGETILVAEDDPDVRLAAIDMLAQLGYKVFSAHDGDGALDVLQRVPHVDLLFTDVVMPGTVRSSELARLASQPPHRAAVVFASGYTRDVIFHEGRIDEGITLLNKPYSLSELAGTIRLALDARSSALALSEGSDGAAMKRTSVNTVR
ncbi:ATP-binding protein [Caballeronia sp. LZ035]|uniref:ATP-binding protein n=1 Tax=Caballeronia sp. LZ035 TaxID=3038568 RepID=UPI00285B264D|nr:ATP-binding protein [Caballeronia sp. LZ035]MDR5761246.1 ATP-binding protein [Caballeronia sp. LZ035]